MITPVHMQFVYTAAEDPDSFVGLNAPTLLRVRGALHGVPNKPPAALNSPFLNKAPRLQYNWVRCIL
jgi:hypothetical protein